MVETLEIAESFQKTEVGVIPNDWKIVLLEKLSIRIGDGIHSTPKYSDNGEFYFVNGNNLKNGRIVITEGTKRVSRDEYHTHKRELNNSTVLLSINGTIGNMAFYKDESIVLGKSAAYINLNDKLERSLLFQVLQSEFIEDYYNNELTGSTIKNLGLGSIRNTPIPLPPTRAEQTAIATALSDMDALIEAQEKLIAKKRHIKQGAMQELLKPKEGWVVKTLSKIAHFENGKAHEQFIDNHGDFVVVNSKFISTEGQVRKYSKQSISPLKKGDITIVMSDIPNGRALAKCFLIDSDIKYTLNQRIGSITAYEETNNKYLFYQLNRNKYYLAFDSGTGQTNIKRQEILDCPVALPPTKTEQTLIASTLTDMEMEIEQLESQLSKYKMLKTGMMQELLTGKKRLLKTKIN